MRTMTALVAGLALAIAVSGCSKSSGAAAAADAMGATNLNAIQFSGSGANYAFGQAYSPGGPWPRFEVKTYTVAIDYQTPAMKLDMLRAQGEHPPRGGGAHHLRATSGRLRSSAENTRGPKEARSRRRIPAMSPSVCARSG